MAASPLHDSVVSSFVLVAHPLLSIITITTTITITVTTLLLHHLTAARGLQATITAW